MTDKGKILVAVVDMYGNRTELLVSRFLTGSANTEYCKNLTLACRKTLEPLIMFIDGETS